MISPDALVSPGAQLGPDCTVGAGAVIGDGVVLGRGVQVGAGCVLQGPCRVGDESIVGAGALLSGAGAEGGLVIEAGVHIGVGAMLPCALNVARGARIEAGTLILRAVPPHAIVAGNPAQIIGYVENAAVPGTPAPDARIAPAAATGSRGTGVLGVTLHRLPKILDLRGNLSVGEFERSLPFAPKRYFLVFGVPNAEIRGEHAHRTCKQFLICVHGSCSVVVDDGAHREEHLLDDPSLGVYLPALTWGIQYKYSHDAVLLVFASEYYDSAEYIRDYSEFLQLTAARSA